MQFRTILCEDNESVREVITFLLEERGHEVFSYVDAGDCPLSSYDECKCNHRTACSDIIISDVAMPKVNGLQFVEHLKKHDCKINNIALVSGYWTPMDVLRAKGLGCSVFYKPVMPEDLFEWIESCEKNIDPLRKLLHLP